ncbi:MAG: hypothetical protein LBE22_12500 [Azoarcus sp.]|jgi:hypothetical protein|nr:hypothetical protein [Azoarcus sp.]
MKTRILKSVAYLMLFALLSLTIGWLIYPWLLDAIIAGSGVTLSSPSISALTTNRLWAALSFALLGAVTSGFSLFLKHKITTDAVSGGMVSLILIALSSVAGWLFYIQHKIASTVRGFTNVSVSIESIPVYEAGIFASIAVLLTTLLLIVWAAQKKQRTS